MDALIKYGLGTIIVLALLAAAGAWVAHAWNEGIAEPYRQEGRVELAPKIASLTTERDDALKAGDEARAANTKLARDLVDLKQAVAEAKAQWDARDAEEAQQLAASKRIAAEAQAKSKSLEADVAWLSGIVKRTPSTEVCDGICARADRLLDGLVPGSVRH